MGNIVNRRPANKSRAEVEIRAIQAERVKNAQAEQALLDKLARSMKTHLNDGASATEIASWVTSPEKPRGVTRQYVYKLVEERGSKPSPRPKPKVMIRPTRK